MDLKSAGDRNSKVDRLTRAGMAVCFLTTGALLIGTLAFNELHDGPGFQFPLANQLRAR